ncbi:MAG: PilZ domain-containing protein [Gammaproteobacteria bacterium]
MADKTTPDPAVPTDTPTPTTEGGNVFFVNIQDKTNLFHTYMPFIIEGGLFVRTDKHFNLDDEVFLLIKLIDEPEKYTIRGRVVWITPSCAQAGRIAGIGVQFGDNARELKAKIETYLAGALTADRPTDTM